jgi:hypothetical protein
MTTRFGFEIGTTIAGMINLEELTIDGGDEGIFASPVTPPKSTFSPYVEVIELADGSMRGRGAAIASWHWDVIPRTQRDRLRMFCPAPAVSSSVYIRTYTKDNAQELKLFHCKMIWPVTDEERNATRAVDFTIEFKQLTGCDGLLDVTLGTLTLVGTGTVV